MRNFGLLKSIVENSLVKTYKTEDFKQIIKEFRDFIKDNKAVGELYVEYGTLMKTKGLNEEVAKEFLGLSVDNIKSTINNNKREFEQFDAWVETLGEGVENQYELIDNMVFAKTADDFLTDIIDLNPDQAVAAFKEMVLNKKNPKQDEFEVLNLLRNAGLKDTANYLHALI